MKTKLFFILAVFSMLLTSCSKENKKVPVQILLTDNPTDYDAVNVHLKGMEVKISNQSWIAIQSKDTLINLLDLQNGVTTLIAQDDLPQGTLQEVRLILGTDNHVVVDGTSYPLQIPSAASSGLKIKIDKSLNETLNSFVLDFDAALSVKEEPDGYKLYPVIKLK